MKIIRNIGAAWKSMSKKDKLKYALSLIGGIGCGLVSGDLGDKLSKGHSIFGRVCIKITTIGLGMAASNAITNAFCEEIDGIAEIMDAKKKLKATPDDDEDEEEDADE